MDDLRKFKEIIQFGNPFGEDSEELGRCLTRLFFAQKAVLIAHNGSSSEIVENLPPRVVFSSGVEKSDVLLFEEYFHELDPMKGNKYQIIRMSDVILPKEFQKTEFYNDFFRPMGSMHSLSARCTKTHLELSFNRGPKQPDFTREDIERIRHILLDMEFALRMHHPSPTDWERKVSSLTARERQLLGHLCSGGQLREFSNAHNISYHTARSQIKSLLAKMDARNQVDLVAKHFRFLNDKYIRHRRRLDEKT